LRKTNWEEFNIRFKEHITGTQCSYDSSLSAKHILGNQLAYGPTEDIMYVKRAATNGVSMDVQERYRMCRVGKQGSILKEQYTAGVSVLFELALIKNG
jgi:sugar/nucleoside kinase (ribokinase family)